MKYIVMKFALVFAQVCIASISHAAGSSKPPNRLIATTHQGHIHGLQVHEKVNAFLGVPYALPPVGPLRFEAPQPLMNYSSHGQPKMLNATRFGPVCHQFHYRSIMGDSIVETSGQSEDCLTLNVFVPHQVNCCSRTPLPVFVWSFGGAFGEGGGSAPLFNPTKFVVENKDIIVVTWNYRVNLFGFPNSPALKAQNLGIRDQRVALEWLRDNISGFGGDPSRIVLGGQSAGADTGSAMMYSHKDDPIVSGLALQSGTVQVIGAATEYVDSEFVRVAEAVGCANSTDRLSEVECMKRVDADDLKHAISKNTFNTFGSPAGGAPMVDNVTIFNTQEYINRGTAGRFAKIPTLMGNTENELDSVLNWSEKCGINRTLAGLGTTSIFTCNMALEAGFRSLHRVPVWRYRYMGVFPAVTPYPWLRAYHQADIPILLGTYEELLRNGYQVDDATVKASRYMQQLFGAFIRDPSHGLKRVYNWPTFVPNKATLIDLFPNNTASAEFKLPKSDEVCRGAAPFPWLEVLKEPPTC